MEEKLKISALYSSPYATVAVSLLEAHTYPWEVLPHISDFILSLGKTLSTDAYERIADDVWISKDATVARSAEIHGPCIVCKNAEIRHCAYIRGSVIVGEGAVVGNSTELKNCILFDGVQVPHYNYVGDSILGKCAHMGAGAVTSNVKSDKSAVSVSVNGTKLDTGRRKCGAMLGDFVEVGCHTVLNPGTVIGAHSNIYPRSSVRGYVPDHHIFKETGNVVKKN
ncbi:MAG: UDP-N-acetylglucosamine pyrophosphorylase [Ruminococcaceae bacterium]|nr:UDP-N-acetylglucosamine pyrophosphorylase [Oscillospiraceae bacterium]